MSIVSQMGIPIWREATVGLEHWALTRDPVLHGAGVPEGDGMPVLLIPGFLAGDVSLGLMARWLDRIGHLSLRASIRANVDCTERAVGRLERLLERAVAHHGRQAAIVGQSRGGMMARVLAVRRPDLVERIICLGSPLTDPFAVHPLVRFQAEAIALVGSVGFPGAFSRGCRDGDCCTTANAQLTGTFPEDVAFTSIYSRSDGIVDWRSCLDPAAELIEVSSSHMGMALNRDVFQIVGEALA